MARASRSGKQRDFERAHRGRGAPEQAVLVSPSDHLVPAAVRQFGTALDAEREGDSERACDNLAVEKSGKSVVEVIVEYGAAEIQFGRRVVLHEFRPDTLQVLREDRGDQIRSLPQRKYVQTHRSIIFG